MKDSGIPWIGKIPKNWEKCRLKSLFEINKVIANELGHDILSVTQKGLKIKDITSNEGQISQDYTKYQIVKPDDFVMNHMDLLTGFVDLSLINGVTSPDYRVFSAIKRDNIDLRYYLYIFQYCYYGKVFYGLGQGVSLLGRWRLQTDKFLNFAIPNIKFSEQQSIAAFLDEKCANIDQLITLQQQMIGELKAYKQSVITEAVTKGLDKSVPMKDSGIEWIGDIPSSWNVVQLSSIFKEHKNKNKLLEVVNLLSLSYGRIIKKNINTKEGLLPQSFDGYNIIQEGDIVFRLTDLQNDKKSLRTGICKEKGIITSAYITLRKTQELHSGYFHYLFHSYDVSKVFYGLGDGVRQGMTFDDLRKLLLIYPPLHIQQQITFYLDQKSKQIEYLISIKQQKIDELKEYKKSMIYEYITGKKQVPN